MQSAMIILVMAAGICAANGSRAQNMDAATAMGQRQFGVASTDLVAHSQHERSLAFRSLDSSLELKKDEPCQPENEFKLGVNDPWAKSDKEIMKKYLERCSSNLMSVKVDMSDKDEVDKYIKKFAETRVQFPRLQSLHLIGRSYRFNGPNNFLGMTKAGAEALAKIFGKSSALVELRMDATLLDEGGGRRLAQEQDAFRRLRLLDMSSNPHGARMLFRTIKEWPSLEHLRLNFDKLEQQDASELAAALQGAPELKTLELRWNRILDTGAKQIAGALSQKMEVLNLDTNGIEGEGAEALAKSLSGSRATLREVSLQFNKIDDRGVSALVEALKDAPNLWKLDLRYNHVTGAGARALADAFEHLPSLTHFNIMGNFIDGENCTYMVSAWIRQYGSQYTDEGNRRDDMSFQWDPQQGDFDDF